MGYAPALVIGLFLDVLQRRAVSAHVAVIYPRRVCLPRPSAVCLRRQRKPGLKYAVLSFMTGLN